MLRDEGRPDDADMPGRGAGTCGRRRSRRGGRLCAASRGRRSRALPGRRRRRLRLLRSFGDGVALLVFNRLQCFGPGLSRRLAGAGRIVLGAKAECIRQRRIGLAGERDGLVQLPARIGVDEQRSVRRRAQRLAGLLVLGETRRHRRKRDREKAAVAGAHAEGSVGAGGRCRVGAWRSWIRIVVAEQVGEEVAGTGCCVDVLRSTVVLAEGGKNRAALVVATIAHAVAAAQLLEAGLDLIQIVAHLLDPIVDRTALRRPPGEERKEPGTIAPHAPGLRRHAVELLLLLVGGGLVTVDLSSLRRVRAAAPVEDGKLCFKPRANRIAGWRRALRIGLRLRRALSNRLLLRHALRNWLWRHLRIHLRPCRRTLRKSAEQRNAGK